MVIWDLLLSIGDKPHYEFTKLSDTGRFPSMSRQEVFASGSPKGSSGSPRATAQASLTCTMQ